MKRLPDGTFIVSLKIMAILAQLKEWLILTVLSFLSLNLNSAGKAVDQSDTQFTYFPESNDVYDFSVKATDAACLEILLGKIATLESKRAIVKKLGSILSHDFMSMNDLLRSATVNCNITLPEEMSESKLAQVDMCFEQPCDSFDVKYVEIVIRDHEGLLAEFQKASLRLSDPNVRNFARNYIPIIQRNLDSATVIFSNLQ